jgi:hypothetical protein
MHGEIEQSGAMPGAYGNIVRGRGKTAQIAAAQLQAKYNLNSSADERTTTLQPNHPRIPSTTLHRIQTVSEHPPHAPRCSLPLSGETETRRTTTRVVLLRKAADGEGEGGCARAVVRGVFVRAAAGNAGAVEGVCGGREFVGSRAGGQWFGFEESGRARVGVLVWVGEG